MNLYQTEFYHQCIHTFDCCSAAAAHKYTFNNNYKDINNKGLLNLKALIATGNRWFSPALEHQCEHACTFSHSHTLFTKWPMRIATH